MSNLADIREKLMNKACEQFQGQIENTEFEKPAEEETFKENESTAEAVKKQLEYEAEMARVKKMASQGAYTVDESNKTSSSKKAETTSNSTSSGSGSSWGGYGGYGYSGYGYSAKQTTSVDSSEEALKKKAAREKAEKIIKSTYEESKDSCSVSTNIFDMAKEACKEKELNAMKIQNPGQYKTYIAKQKGKVNIARDVLEVVKGILEDMNMYRR